MLDYQRFSFSRKEGYDVGGAFGNTRKDGFDVDGAFGNTRMEGFDVGEAFGNIRKDGYDVGEAFGLTREVLAHVRIAVGCCCRAIGAIWSSFLSPLSRKGELLHIQ